MPPLLLFLLRFLFVCPDQIFILTHAFRSRQSARSVAALFWLGLCHCTLATSLALTRCPRPSTFRVPLRAPLSPTPCPPRVCTFITIIIYALPCLRPVRLDTSKSAPAPSHLARAIALICTASPFQVLGHANRYIDQNQPWVLAKTPDGAFLSARGN